MLFRSPKGDVLLNLASDDAVGIIEINRRDLVSYREQFPAFLDSDQFELGTAVQ